MTFIKNNTKLNVVTRNNQEVGFEKIMEIALDKAINQIREKVLSEDTNQVFENMKANGVENINEYILNMLDEESLVRSIEIRIEPRYLNSQVVELNKGLEVLSKDEMNLIKDSKMPSENMAIVRESIEEGLPFDKIKMIDASKLSSDSLLELKKAIADGKSIDELQVLTNVGGSLGSHNIIATRRILDGYGIEAAKFITHNRFNSRETWKVNLMLNQGVELKTIEYLIDKNLVKSKDLTMSLELMMDNVYKGLVKYNINHVRLKEVIDESIANNVSYSDLGYLLSSMSPR